MTFLAGVAYGLANWAALTASAPRPPNPSLWEQILLAPPLLTLMRLAILLGASYFVASLVGLVLEGRWISKAGPSGAEADPAPALESIQAAGEELDERMASLEEAAEILAAKIQEIEARIP